VASTGSSGDGAYQVRITLASEIAGFESVMAHNCVAQVVSVESGQGLGLVALVLDHLGPISPMEHAFGAPSSPSGTKRKS
jgi:hypothetical protein